MGMFLPTLNLITLLIRTVAELKKKPQIYFYISSIQHVENENLVFQLIYV